MGTSERSISRRQLAKGIGIAVGGAVLPLSKIGALGAAGPSKSPETVVYQMGWVKSVQFGGHFAAVEHNDFQDEGIKADFRAGGPNVDPITIVASGQALIGDRGSTDLILARAKGVPVKAFGAIFQKSPYALMSLKSKPIRTLKDMVGKTIALPDVRRATVIGLLRRAGIDEAKVTFVPVGTDPSILATGQVDGYFGFATNQGIVLRSRGVDIEIAYLSDLGDVAYAQALFATDETIAAKRDLLVRWLRADIRGWQWAVDNPEAVAKLMVDKYGQKGLDLNAQTAEAKAQAELITAGDAARKGVLWISAEVFDQAIKLASESGLIKSAFAPGDVMTAAIVEAAYGGKRRL
jgi:ABC-type nitrate/sulfonate/bicarbonate transport system substrate-binding protein